jgi:hypothetical protein
MDLLILVLLGAAASIGLFTLGYERRLRPLKGPWILYDTANEP